MPHEPLTGLLVLDKPTGITSRDAVDRAQRWVPRRTRIGHTGTLDPLASGVLVLCVGSATRLTEYVQQMSKTYRTTIRLGAGSDTDDAEGRITPVVVSTHPQRSGIEDCLRGFIGDIEQVPPAFSAAKITGQRAYDLARKGEDVALRPRSVHIDSINVLRYEFPLLEMEIVCGKGTYIRSLARDLGERLDCGGLVEILRRTRIGPFRVEDALTLDAARETAQSKLLPIDLAVSDLPRLVLPVAEVQRLRQGQSLTAPGGSSFEEAAVFGEEGKLIAVVRLDQRDRQIRPVKVLG
jgi:tRNA pseudouridine55 synthase